MAASPVLGTDLREMREYVRERGISSLRELWDDIGTHDERLSRAMDGGTWIAMACWFGLDTHVRRGHHHRFWCGSGEASADVNALLLWAALCQSYVEADADGKKSLVIDLG